MLLNPYRFGGFVGPLDVLGLTPFRAFSLRRLLGSYTANICIQVRRSSDNTTANIGFDAAGDLDTATLLTFCGAGNGFVTGFFDQSVNATPSLSQVANANQPQIVSSGALINLTTGKPGILFDGSNDFLAQPVSGNNYSQPFTRSHVLKFNGVLNGQNVVSDGATNGFGFFPVDGTLITNGGTILTIKTGIAANDVAAVMEIQNGASGGARYNATTVSGNTGANAMPRVMLGGATDASNAGAFFANCTVSEHIIFTSALGGTDASALEANQKAYWGTP